MSSSILERDSIQSALREYLRNHGKMIVEGDSYYGIYDYNVPIRSSYSWNIPDSSLVYEHIYSQFTGTFATSDDTLTVFQVDNVSTPYGNNRSIAAEVDLATIINYVLDFYNID